MAVDKFAWEKAARTNPLKWTGHYPFNLQTVKIEALNIAKSFLLSEDILLDLGCGLGLYNLFWTEIVKEQILTDISETMLRIAKYVLMNTQSNVHFVNCDVRYLPFREKSVSKCVCLGVLKHLHPNPLATFKALKDMERTLKVGGLLYVNDLNVDLHVNALIQKLTNMFKKVLRVFTVDSYFYKIKDLNVILKILCRGQKILRSYGWVLPFSDLMSSVLPSKLRVRVEWIFKTQSKPLPLQAIIIPLYSNVELIYKKRG